MVKDLTKGNSLKLIVSFCLPLMLGQLFQQFYNMVDSIIVGRFAGTQELSAVGSTGSLSFLVLGFVTGFTSGIAIPLAQAFGAGDKVRLRKLFANCIYLTSAATVILTLLTFFLTRPILKLMNTPDEIFEMAYDYIGTIFLGLVTMLFYNLFACVIRALGDSRTPLILLIFSSLLNIALDLFFVTVLHLDCLGVAIATVIAQGASAVLALIIIIKKFKILHFSKVEAKPDIKQSLVLLHIGLPMALQMSITAVGSVMLQSAVNNLGSNVIAAVTIGGKVQLMLVLPSESIGITMATFCGQNLGARRLDRIKRGIIESSVIALIYAALAMVIAWFFGAKLGTLFVSGDQTAVLGYVGQFLRVCCKFYPILAILFILRNSIQGLGYSLPAMMAGFFELAARAIMGYLIIPKYGYTAVCYANPSAWAAANLLLVPVFFAVYFILKKKLKAKPDSEVNANA